MYWLQGSASDFPPEAYEKAYAALSESRKNYIDRLRRPQDRNRSLAGELLVQKLLTEQLGITDAAVHRRENGQPYLTGCDLHVSISHSDERIVCAVSSQPVGIDVERIRPMDLKIARHVCVEEEMAYLMEGYDGEGVCQDPAVLRRFFEIWTAKEAYFKKCGTGITNLKSVNTLTLKRQIFLVQDYLIQII